MKEEEGEESSKVLDFLQEKTYKLKVYCHSFILSFLFLFFSYFFFLICSEKSNLELRFSRTKNGQT